MATSVSAVCAALMQAAERTLETADLLLRAGCSDVDRLQLACQGYQCLLIGAYLAGNIMEACRVKWIMDRPEFIALPAFKHKMPRRRGTGKALRLDHCSISSMIVLGLVVGSRTCMMHS